MKELVLELLCHLLRAGQGLEFMAEQPLNDAMNDISLTSQYAGDLKTLPHKCRAGEKGSKGEEVQGPRGLMGLCMNCGMGEKLQQRVYRIWAVYIHT